MKKTVSLGDEIELIGGGTPKTTEESYWNGDIPWLSVVDFNSDERWVENTEKNITELGLENSSTKLLSTNDIIISARGTVGEIAQLKRPMAFNQSCYGIRAKSNLNQDYLYYLLKHSISDLQRQAHGGVFSTITRETFKHIKIEVSDITTQKKIANTLGAIDEKIELNRKMNETLEQIGQALFRHYFIDNPEAKKWEKRTLGEFFPVKTGKKDANFSADNGVYPFFTCAQTISKAPDFSFDAHALLLAGNGDFNLKLYRGKFEAYQRTYVLVPNDERLVGLLYFLMQMKLSEITGGSRGSVIKFITKGMIENYKFTLPDDNELISMAEVFNQLTINIEENVKQIQTLTTLRDTLLPRLISGKVKV